MSIHKQGLYWFFVLCHHCQFLTHWVQVTHICMSKLTIIGSDNGLLPGLRQAIIWTNVGTSSIGPLGTQFSAILIEIHIFSFKKMHLKMLSRKWQPFCLGLWVAPLTLCHLYDWPDGGYEPTYYYKHMMFCRHSMFVNDDHNLKDWLN